LLATLEGVAQGGRVEAVAPGALGPFGRSRPDRLGEGFLSGLSERCGPRGGKRRPARIRRIRANRARSAICCARPKRCPPRGDPLGGQCPRLEGLRGGHGRYLCDTQASWTTAQAPEEALHADKGYDFPRCRKALRKRGITPRIARRGIESSERLGRYPGGW
jgi:hypothetical protein